MIPSIENTFAKPRDIMTQRLQMQRCLTPMKSVKGEPKNEFCVTNQRARQPMPDIPIPEELITLVHAISEDKNLCERFLSLQQLPPVLRQAQLVRITAQMRSAGEDPAAAHALSTLMQPRVYDAACSTLRELCF